MSRIRQLPPHVVARIAAGEVIERPASVVKELLENAVDAGATRIDVEIEAGGVELIRVCDDGHGIHPDDLPLAFAPHATSKLLDPDDLFHIGTMGFRGEALASVGGVAKVLMQSRRQGTDAGAEVRCDGGELGPVRPWNGSTGTRVEVRHLFYNVPARRKFLKSLATEHAHVCEAVTRLALAFPGLHLTLRHNGKPTFEVPATAPVPDRAALFFGGEVRDALYHLDTGPGPYRLSGYIADPACDRGNPKLLYLFVNGRWFRDRSVAFAVQEGFRGLLMTGRYPVGFLFLEVPPDQVDVNVHPTKAEVRFRDNALVFSLVRAAVKNRLLKENKVPQLTVPADGPVFSPRREAAEAVTAPWEGRVLTADLLGRVESARSDGSGLNVLPPSPPRGEGLGVRGGGFVRPESSSLVTRSAGDPPPTPSPSPPRGEGSRTQPRAVGPSRRGPTYVRAAVRPALAPGRLRPPGP